MIDELINRMKQAYRDLESGQQTYVRAQARAEELTPQVAQAVPLDAQAAGMPQAPQNMPQQPAQPAQQPSLLDILASRR